VYKILTLSINYKLEYFVLNWLHFIIVRSRSFKFILDLGIVYKKLFLYFVNSECVIVKRSDFESRQIVRVPPFKYLI